MRWNKKELLKINVYELSDSEVLNLAGEFGCKYFEWHSTVIYCRDYSYGPLVKLLQAIKGFLTLHGLDIEKDDVQIMDTDDGSFEITGRKDFPIEKVRLIVKQSIEEQIEKLDKAYEEKKIKQKQKEEEKYKLYLKLKEEYEGE